MIDHQSLNEEFLLKICLFLDLPFTMCGIKISDESLKLKVSGHDTACP